MSALIECGSIHHKRCDEHTKNSVRHSQAGFTLIEAMIVVIVMGVLVAVAAPSIEYQLKNQRNKQTSETIVSALREARTESLLRRQNIVFVPSANGLSVALRLNTESGTVLRQYNFPEKAPAVFASGNITFRSNKTVGFANGNSAEIVTYCDKNKTSAGRKVMVDNNGNIKPITGGSLC